MFENMGVEVADERPYEIEPAGRQPVWIYDFGLTSRRRAELDGRRRCARAFQDAFVRAWRGDVENDGYNRLVLRARLTWREVTVLRAIARYLRQTGTTFSDHYVEQALVGHPARRPAARRAVRARFDPARADAERGRRA